MGEVGKFDPYGNLLNAGDPAALGVFVLATDYATLEAENAKLRAELERRVVPEPVVAATLFRALVDDFKSFAVIGDCPHDGGEFYQKEPLYLAAPSAPKADDPVKVQLLEALEYFVSRKAAILAKFDIHGPADIAAGMRIKFGQAEAAIAAARQEGGK